MDPGAKPFSSGDKAVDRLHIAALAREIDAPQDMFYANCSHKLLILLQRLDMAGKDSAICTVAKEVPSPKKTSPLDVRTTDWTTPTRPELAHDYLWHIHQQVPAADECMIHNRSHHEDVLEPVVDARLSKRQTRQRDACINDFESMRTETGTIVMKFMPHVSKNEQRQRLQERIADPRKHWKFSLGDFEVRKQWDDYQCA